MIFISAPAEVLSVMEIRISITPRCVLRILLRIVMVLTLASVAASFFHHYVVIDNLFLREVQESLFRLFWLDGEANIPTWFSSASMLLCAGLLTVITVASKKAADRNFRHWGVLACIFLYLSLDETAIFHEMAIKPLRTAFHPSGLLYYAWVIPYGVGTFIFGFAYLKFLLYLPRKTKLLFTVAGLLFVGGAIGVEGLSGLYAEQYGEAGLWYEIIITIEEGFEMLGIMCFIYALLDYMRAHVMEVEVRVLDVH